MKDQSYHQADRDEGVDWLANLLEVLFSSLWAVVVVVATGLWGLLCWARKMLSSKSK